ncbi:DUF4136 domain-containing protein [Dyadobacter frigoris]|uniref:DUF4136 domain-containing protein n=1 Tax=Dyadobacter frigoris TaxID=2576211 RepID=A0A4U6CNX4_9BACT|nr:DUF4136 domain-containing protein [Dyadobacter frigoris]TKT85081.1 DUF4136 domain-containing protein [Dyadobacter frigoris]GLU57344.1 hypothetical protein Dfri01_68050 [Dyadobacter frigoris]
MKKILIIALIGLYGCSPAIRAYYNYDKEDPIQKYKTFNWAAGKQTEANINPLYYNELTDGRIKRAANDLLQVKGYLLTDQDSDLSVRYHIEMEERSVFWPDPDGYMYGDYFMRPRSDVFTYRQGTLSIDFVNTKNRNLVWRGWAVAAMEVVNYDKTDTEVLIRSAVTKILQNLPEAERDSVPAVTFR